MRYNILTTVGELINRNMWSAYCMMMGINIWSVNEGKINSADPIKLSLREAVVIGLVKKGRPDNI